MTKIVRKSVEKSVEGFPSTRKKKKLPKNVVIKNGSWYVRKSIKVGGNVRQIWRVCPEQTAEAVAEILSDIKKEISFVKTGLEKPLSSFREIAERFKAAELTPAVFSNQKKISGKIHLSSPVMFLENLIEHFASQDINSITFGQIQDYKKKRLSTPVVFPKGGKKQRSIRSVNYELTVLKQVFNYAVRHRWMARNPFLDGKNLIDTALENKRYVTWTKKEEAAALSLCTDARAHLKPIILLMVDGGMRRNEILTARWSDVDFENEFLLAKNYKGNALSVRKIYFTNRIKEALLEWKTIQPKIKKADKSRMIGFSDIKNSWTAIRKAIKRDDLHLHDLRHVFATRLAEKVPLAAISKLLGHSNLKTTQIYINPEDAALKEAIKTLEEDVKNC